MTNTDFFFNLNFDQAVAAARTQRLFVEQLADASDRARDMNATASFVVQNRMFVTMGLELVARFGPAAMQAALRDA